MKTKILLWSLFAMLFLFNTEKTFASHMIGNCISYEYMAPNQYMLTMKLYRDCAGISAPVSAVLCYQSASTGLNGSDTLNQVTGTGIEIQPSFCFTGSGTSTCNGGSNFGMQEYVYQGILTLPQAANDWIISFEQCCRNNAVTTLVNAAGFGSYVYTKMDNLNYPVNSSPQFSSPPFAQYCLNVMSTYSFACIDPDGDSLVYSLANAEDATGVCPSTPIAIAYNTPFSGTNPVSSSIPLVFNPATGTLIFNPNLIQVAVIAMLVQEYRNGVLIGEVKRDDEIIITNGIAYPDMMKGKVFIDQNSNTVYDAGEPGLNGTIIEVQPGSFYGSSNYFGDYALPLAPGSYTGTIPAIPPYYVTTPFSNSATFTATFQTDSMNDFALTAPSNVQDLRIFLSALNPWPAHQRTTHLTYSNAGTASMSGTINMTYDTVLNFISCSVLPSNVIANTLTWTFSNLAPFSSGNIDIILECQNGIPLGTPTTSYAEILPLAGDSVPMDNTDTLFQIVSSSLDPNVKAVDPDGPITTTDVAGGKFLEYTIYFQNTGTAPATNIYIDDTLDQNFNIPTFEVLSASHNYTWNISGPGIIKFSFNNIMLPDSGSDELNSHGFIKYRIKPKNNLAVGDKMTNTAYIIFDSNSPVVTNSTSTTVINPTSVIELYGDITDLLAYPNPANNFLNIEMNLKEATLLNMHLYNLMGEVVWKSGSRDVAGLFTRQINMNDFSKGIYFLKIATSKGMSVVKIVKN